MRRTPVRRLRKRLREAARAQGELEKRMFQLKALYDLSVEIGFLMDPRTMIGNLLMMIVGTFGVERGVIVLVDVRDSKIRALTARGLDDGDEALLASATETGELVRAEPSAAPASVVVAGAPSPLSRLGLDVTVRFDVNDNIRGVIGLGEKLTGDPYTADDGELLVTLANQAAIAIANATAHEEVVAYAEQLASSLKRIQILESMKQHLAKFVPTTVQALIEESPEAPLLDKQESDVSVLFVDITGYTRLSAQLDLERVNQLVEVYFGAFLDEIIALGGDVNETAGDGLMVIFSNADPAAHATAAVRAALAIQRRTREINGTLEGYFEPITIHVGVNSGIAMVGATKIEGAAGTRWTYTASGPTTNIAARLAALGDGGDVVISEDTWRRIGSGFQAVDLGPQSLKNVARDVRAYRVMSEGVAPSDTWTSAARRNTRRPVSWRVRLWSGERVVEGTAIDASLFDLRVACVVTDRLTIDARCYVEITDGAGKVLRCTAVVRHVGEGDVGLETKEPIDWESLAA